MTTDNPPPREGGHDDGFQEYRIHRSDEPVLALSVQDVARVDEDLRDVVGGAT
ncbi:hypothetical protein [Halobaculum sp. P14]|uniref:hypothetical protein n=1 Tax=Halobaculum sp. P14 TaxID=3421638 RepID=UPI003EBB3E4B